MQIFPSISRNLDTIGVGQGFPSDGANMVPLHEAESLLQSLKQIAECVRT